MYKSKAFLSSNIARKLFVIPGILLLCLFGKCSPEKQHQVSTGFYYWKTNFHLNSEDQALLAGTKATTLYLRLFDVDWNAARQQALPVGVFQAKEVLTPGAMQYVPAVYITQSCLQHLREQDVPVLARQISALMGSLCSRYSILPQEIQIDCDWTKSNAAVYFSLLRQLRLQPVFSGKMLSCTIRLHQVKFASASGIPPVDRGLLMVYNMGNLTRYGGQNSILDVAEAKKYLRHLDIYPLPLDVAVPVYHWAVLFRHKKFEGITYNLSLSDFKTSDLEHKDGNRYRILRDTATGGYTFLKGQEIRFEQPQVDELKEIGAFISQHIRDSSFRLNFFHLDPRSIKPFDTLSLQEISSTFR